MSPLQGSAFGASEFVHRWLSDLEGDSTRPAPPGLDRGATRIRHESQQKTSQARHTRSNPIGLKQAKLIRLEEPRGRRGGQSHDDGWIAERVDSERRYGDNNHSQHNIADKVGGKIESHNISIVDPSDKYARRARHKTREDRYEYKDIPGKRVRPEQSKKRSKKKPGATLSEEFKASNVAVERLTLNATGPGFLSKGKASRNSAWKGLPDLTFSEMNFLKRKREEDDARFHKLSVENSKKKTSKHPGQDISEFFSRSTEKASGEMPVPNPPSTGSYVSWSVSQPPRPAASHARISVVIAHSVKPGTTHSEEPDNQSGPTSIHPKSSASNHFLKDFTSNALLRGVDTFTRTKKKYYSLEELKMLAERIDPQVPRNNEPRHNYNTAIQANEPIVPKQRLVPDVLPGWADAPQSSRGEEGENPHMVRADRSYPLLQRRVRSHIVQPELQQNPGDVALSCNLERFDGQSHGLIHVQRQLTPHIRRNIPRVSRLQRHHPDQEPSPLSVPSARLLALGHHDQPGWPEEGDWADLVTCDTQGLDQSDGGLVCVEEGVEFGEQAFRNRQDPLPPGVLGVAGPSQETALVEAIVSPSDELDELDRDLLLHAAAQFTSREWTAVAGGEGRLREARSGRPTQEVRIHWSQPVHGTADDRGVSYDSYCSMQDLHEAANGGYARQAMPEFHEMPHRMVDGAAGGFSGFTRGQILY